MRLWLTTLLVLLPRLAFAFTCEDMVVSAELGLLEYLSLSNILLAVLMMGWTGLHRSLWDDEELLGPDELLREDERRRSRDSMRENERFFVVALTVPAVVVSALFWEWHRWRGTETLALIGAVMLAVAHLAPAPRRLILRRALPPFRRGLLGVSILFSCAGLYAFVPSSTSGIANSGIIAAFGVTFAVLVTSGVTLSRWTKDEHSRSRYVLVGLVLLSFAANVLWPSTMRPKALVVATVALGLAVAAVAKFGLAESRRTPAALGAALIILLATLWTQFSRVTLITCSRDDSWADQIIF